MTDRPGAAARKTYVISSKATDLARVLAELVLAEPTATLERNGVGNLLVVVDGYDIGYIDLTRPEWVQFEEPLELDR